MFDCVEAKKIQGYGRWRRPAAAFGGIGVLLVSLCGLLDPLSSMTTYTGALMMLNQIAPPLLLLAVPPGRRNYWNRRWVNQISIWLLDPWVAGTVFTVMSVAISVPSVFDQALANALFTTPLGFFEFIAGLLAWAQIIPATSNFQKTWKAGLFGICIGVPMTVVAVVWMMSPQVLYMPYINVICLWNFSPLQDQQWSGFVMFFAGLPLQLTGTWLLLGLSSQNATRS